MTHFFIKHFIFQLEEDRYRPLDPMKIRLPPPAPPNERLLTAVDAFYAPPNHERPRDKYVKLLIKNIITYEYT